MPDMANTDIAMNSMNEIATNFCVAADFKCYPKQIAENSFNAPLVRDPNQYWEHSPIKS